MAVQIHDALSGARQYPVSDCDRCGNPFEKTNGRKRFCTPCGPIAERERAAERARERRREDPDGVRQRMREWRAANREHLRSYQRKYDDSRCDVPLGRSFLCGECGVETIKLSGAQKYCDDCSERVRTDRNRARASLWNKQNADSRNLRQKERYESDPEFRLTINMRNAIGDALKGGKTCGTFEALGYSAAELKTHLERQFLPGMTWENWGRGQQCWHVDHIRPKSSFSYRTEEDDDFKDCWALTNLRPLWEPENLSKNARRTHLL